MRIRLQSLIFIRWKESFFFPWQVCSNDHHLLVLITITHNYNRSSRLENNKMCQPHAISTNGHLFRDEPERRTVLFTRRRWIIIRCLFKLSENNFPNYSESILVASAKSYVQRWRLCLCLSHMGSINWLNMCYNCAMRCVYLCVAIFNFSTHTVLINSNRVSSGKQKLNFSSLLGNVLPQSNLQSTHALDLPEL